MRALASLLLAGLLMGIAAAGCLSQGVPKAGDSPEPLSKTEGSAPSKSPAVPNGAPGAPTVASAPAPKASPPALRPLLGFSPEVVVDKEIGADEPSLAVDSHGRIFIAAPGGLLSPSHPSGQFWRSTDGQTFQHLPGLGAAGLYGPSIGGGDSDIAIDAQDNLYAVDLWGGNVGFLASKDHGDTWMEGAPVTFATPGLDRQWIDVNQATGEIYLVANDLATGLWVLKSTDHGQTFLQQTLAVPIEARGGCICPPGVLSVDPVSANVYVPYALGGGGLGLAVSKDGGASFATMSVKGAESYDPGDPAMGRPGGFSVLVHDTQGNLYVVWPSNRDGNHRIALQSSTDQGKTWSDPVSVSPIAEGQQYMPWIVAGEAGRVGIAWYEQTASKEWHVRLAVSDNALGAKPSFDLTTLDHQPVLKGDFDRATLGDFFEIAMDGHGAIHAVWNAMLDGKGTMLYAHQVSGSLLLTGAPRSTAAPAHSFTAPGAPPIPSSAPPPDQMEEQIAEQVGEAGH